MDYDYCPFCQRKNFGNHFIYNINGQNGIGFMCNECYEDTFGRYDDEKNLYGVLRDNKIVHE